MQPMLKTDPYLAAQASDDGRLFLVRTIGPLSGGTPVKMRAVPGEEHLKGKPVTVEGYIQVPVHYRGTVVIQWRRKLVEVEVTLEDLVIRRIKDHPNAPLANRKTRRAVLNKLKEKARK